eukprot:TRINITY_DN4125_c0_g1_i2.p1 TRINITY_DN4125_c0_g1~~TRINITY_DN4125_c0_g1_i2.p1  ORF type:complete len:238 (+),score=44.29 TRINITY_DN4125_c0_g1_i2:58-771(+)
MECHDIDSFHELTVKDAERCACGICQHVMMDAVQGPCQHPYGKRCLEQALQHQSRCPSCRAPLNLLQLTPARLMRNLVDDLPKKCEYGCAERVPLGEYQHHLVHKCKFMKCKHGDCGMIFERDAFAAHQAVCQFGEAGRNARLKTIEQVSQNFRQKVIDNAREAIVPELKPLSKLAGRCHQRCVKLTQELDQLHVPHDDGASRAARKAALGKLGRAEEAAAELKQAMDRFAQAMTEL